MSSSIQFIKFSLVGILNTLVHYLVFYLLFRVAGIAMILASAVGYMTGVLNSYLINRKWTFKPSGSGAGAEFIKFFVVNLVSLGVNLLSLQFLVSALGMLPEIAQVLAIFCSLLVNFSGNKWWTFKQRAPVPGGKTQ
ncbi:GtrA family protein [uncultured Desulfuromusa sp.]|uniref:GtrA family protein n=1 Tax=uncultured Desulfuromusa sp. TaxID=219183 RepID=UPI002AA89C25|nr:GtrA family protein [uncultured Desulfuromusa sp.]